MADSQSDADLLIVMSLDGGRRPIVAEMYRELADAGLPKDLIIVTPAEFDRDANDKGTVIHYALRDGIPLYDRTDSAKRPPMDPAR